MNRPIDYRPLGCSECLHGQALGFDFKMAFQPIVDLSTNQVHSYEALVRGLHGEPASWVLAQVHEGNRYRFDQTCRTKAIATAARLGIACHLNINFMPRAVYRPELCIRTTLEAADVYGLSTARIVFEFTEDERVDDHQHLRSIVEHYQARGFKTAIDDFGAGHSGLNLLATLHTDYVKVDMMLIRGIDRDARRQSICRYLVRLCEELHIAPIAEGIENKDELDCLRDLGFTLVQGYYLAKPALEALPALAAASLAPP